MAARWTQRELTTLVDNLSDGFPVQQMRELLHHRRTARAIMQQAWNRNYRTKTSTVDGITRFYHGVTRRRRDRQIITATEDVQVAVAVEVPAVHAEPQRIIANNGIAANTLAVRMLTENNLSVDPDIVHTLSLHILKELR